MVIVFDHGMEAKALQSVTGVVTHPQRAFRSLFHHVDEAWLHEAYRRTRKDGAVGIDGQTAAAYAADLNVNLLSLLNRAKSCTYRAPPSRRVTPEGGRGEDPPPWDTDV